MVHAPAVGPIAFARGVRSRGFLDFAGDLWREVGEFLPDVKQVRWNPLPPEFERKAERP